MRHQFKDRPTQKFRVEDYEIDKNLVDGIDFLKVLDIPKIEHPLLEILENAERDKDTYLKVSKDSNLLIQFRKMTMIQNYEPDSKYKNAFINLARLNVLLFHLNPYWRSRVGWADWVAINCANPDSYWIYQWEDHYDPRKWYRLGEVRRPEHCGVPEGGNTATS